MKLVKIYNEILKEDLIYHGATTTGVEDDEYEIGPLKESMTTNSFKLTKSDINRYIELGLNSAYDNYEMAHDGLMNILDGLKKLPNIITLYRIVFIESLDDLNTQELGSHYVLDKDDLESSHYSSPHDGANGNPFMISVKAQKNMIDFNTTITNNIQYPHETEITLKNNGEGILLLDKRPLKTQDFSFDDSNEFNGIDDYDKVNYYR